MTTTQTATITRPSMIDGRPFTRTVYIVRDWDYIGCESGRPVIITNCVGGPEQPEILSVPEQATIETVEVACG